MAIIIRYQDLDIKRMIVKHSCRECDGSGRVSAGSEECPKCDNGIVSGFFGDKICSKCDGDGKIYFSKKCDSCSGNGYTKSVDSVSYCKNCDSVSEHCHCQVEKEDYGGEYY